MGCGATKPSCAPLTGLRTTLKYRLRQRVKGSIMSEQKKTLTEAEITTRPLPARRHVLGLLGLGAVATGAWAATGRHAYAQAADADSGTWTDSSSCPRGLGETYTGVTDSDNGTVVDIGGYGRGEPYC